MPIITPFPSALRHYGLALLCVLPLLLGACRHAPQVSIPLQESAGKQYAYALGFRDRSNLELISDEKRFLKIRSIVREHYQKVIDYFPGDRKAAPLAELEVVEMDAGLDASRVKTSDRDLRRSIQQLQELAEKYPEYDYIQAKALYDQGMCFRALREFPQAQAAFRQVNEKFLKSANKDIRDLAIQAGAHYNRTYVNE